MDKSSNILHIEFNNWFSGRDYPVGEPFETWMSYKHANFSDDQWCRDNKLCVYAGNIDMSRNYTITASKEWVEENCPQLLTDEEYDYTVIIYSRGQESREIEHKKYSDFIVKPDEDGDYYGQFGWPFLEYCEENFGVHYYRDPDEYYDDEEEDE